MQPTAAIVLATGFLILFIGSGARFAIGVTLRDMAADFAMGRGTLGIIATVYFAVTAVAMLAAGRMIDRWNPRLVLGAGLIVSAIGIGLITAATATWHVLVLYGIVFAFGNGIASIAPVSVVVTRYFPARAGIANGVISAGMCAGQLVVVALMALVLVSAGWRPIYLWLGVATLALLPLLWAIPAGDPGGTGATIGRSQEGLSLGETLRTRRFWLLAGIFAMCGLDDFFVTTHVVAFAQDKGVDTLLAGNLLAVMGLFALVGTVYAGAASDRTGPWWPTFQCFLLRIGAFLLILANQSTVAVAIFALVFGFTFMTTAPLTVVIARNLFGPRNLGVISGMIVMIHHGVGGLGAWAGGALFDSSGSYDGAFALMLLSSVVAAVLTWLLRSEQIADPHRYKSREPRHAEPA